MTKTEKRISVLIADDYPLMREGLKHFIKANPHFLFAGEAANGRELVEMAAETAPDVILTDICMPVMDGIEATRQIRRVESRARVVAFTFASDEHRILDMLEAGAIGYILKESAKQELADAIFAAYNYRPYYSASASEVLVRLIAGKQFDPHKVKRIPVFSEAEIVIIKMICEQKTTREIAEKLCLSVRTIEGHRLRILDRMQVENTAGIVINAIRMGIYRISKDE